MLTNLRTGKLDLELFTGKHTVRTSDLSGAHSLVGRRTAMNITFTFNSIELRLNGDEAYVLRLTDRYFSLFFRSLLKAYGAFQLNMTSFETASTAGFTHLLNACMSNFRLATRRPLPVGFQLTHYSLIEQTKSVSFYQSDFFSDLVFDSSCAATGQAYFYKYSAGPRAILADSVDPNTCYTVTRVDVLTSQRVDDYLDCQCNSTSCSFNKWSNFTMKSLHNDNEPVFSCKQATEYACFNNATCLDVSLNSIQPFSCQCTGSYTGDRYIIFYRNYERDTFKIFSNSFTIFVLLNELY